uniref:G-protein coupled receptors family 1 profile domain-containing protein n=1 Tax=Monopterus albus TaxID=43700 RepID=A0A3Q3JHT9_MONAL
METTTFDYYDSNYSDEPYPVFSPCNQDSDNNLGSWLSLLYYFMFLFSLFGNGLVLVIIHRFEKLTTLSNWIFGKVMCKIVGSVYYLGFYSSVLFLTLLTFDRHLAVVYSLGMSQVRNTRYAVLSCAVVWLVSGLACIKPMLLHTTFTHYVDNKTYCQEYPGDVPFINVHQLRTSGFYLQLFLFLIFPLAVIIYCYIRIAATVMSSRIVTKFKTVRLIFIIVLLFFMCWTPFNIVLLMPNEIHSCEKAQQKGYALQVTRNIAYIYFCISPIFYTFVGKKFQNYFRQLLVTHYPGLGKYISVSQYSRTISTPNEF